MVDHQGHDGRHNYHSTQLSFRVGRTGMGAKTPTIVSREPDKASLKHIHLFTLQHEINTTNAKFSVLYSTDDSNELLEYCLGMYIDVGNML